VSPELALAVGGVYVVLQVAEGQVLVPLVMRNTIGISPFLVIASLLVGGAVGGIPGAFLAVPTVAAVEVVLERLQARRVPVAQDPGSRDESPIDDDEASGRSSSERGGERLSPPKPVRATRP
jgi:predicted PurR-regulated permease PerM